MLTLPLLRYYNENSVSSIDVSLLVAVLRFRRTQRMSPCKWLKFTYKLVHPFYMCTVYTLQLLKFVYLLALFSIPFAFIGAIEEFAVE